MLKADQIKYQNIYDHQKQVTFYSIKNLDSVNHKLDKVSEVMQDTVYQKDVYNEMLQNLKRDIITMKKRYFDMDTLLTRDNTKLRSLKSEAFTKQKLGQSCRKML